MAKVVASVKWKCQLKIFFAQNEEILLRILKLLAVQSLVQLLTVIVVAGSYKASFLPVALAAHLRITQTKRSIGAIR